MEDVKKEEAEGDAPKKIAEKHGKKETEHKKHADRKLHHASKEEHGMRADGEHEKKHSEPGKTDEPEIAEKLDSETKSHARPALIDEGKLEVGVIVLTALFLIIVIFNQYQIQSITGDIDKKAAEAEASKKPALVQLAVINDDKCAGCYDIGPLVSSIKAMKNINVTSEKELKFDDAETKELISKYGIESLPTVVLKGDLDRAHASLQAFSRKDDILYLASIPPPYYEAATGSVRGLVKLVHIADQSCTKCSSTATFGAQLKAAGVSIKSEEVVASGSSRGKELISKYGIRTLPSITLSEDAVYYPVIAQAWAQIGDVASDGTYVLRTANPPFVNVSTGMVSGIVLVTYLADKSCEKCYDPKIHGQILKQSYAMALENETAIDISEKQGKDLAKKYNITGVPTVIISADAKYYPSFAQVWRGVGSVEADGVFIFRNFNAFAGNPYRNLTTGAFVENPAPQQ